MGESPRAGPTRRTDPTSAAAATAATPARTQHGGGQAGPNYSSGRAREVRSPPKAGSAAPPPPAPPPLTSHLPFCRCSRTLTHLCSGVQGRAGAAQRSCGVGQCRGLGTAEGRGSVRHGEQRARSGGTNKMAATPFAPSPSPSLGASTRSNL